MRITKNSDPITCFFPWVRLFFDLNGSYCVPKIMTINEIIHCERGNNK